jgi:hypothetical protein
MNNEKPGPYDLREDFLRTRRDYFSARVEISALPWEELILLKSLNQATGRYERMRHGRARQWLLREVWRLNLL